MSMTSMVTGLPERGSTPVALLRAQTVSPVSRNASIVSFSSLILRRASSICAFSICGPGISVSDRYSCSISFSAQTSSATLRSPSLDDRLEAFQIHRHAHCSGFRPGGHGDRDAGCADAEFAPRHSHCPVVSDSGRPCGKVSESACIF